MTDAVRLEAFERSLRGRKICIFGEPTDWLLRLSVLEGESLYKGRTVLVIGGQGRGWAGRQGLPPASLMRRRWDAIFSPRENFDYQMLLTYITNAPKPCRVCWWQPEAAAAEIPRVVWSKFGPEVTLFGFQGGLTRGDLWGVEWDAILFPLSVREDFVGRVLSSRGSGIRAAMAGLTANLDEIRANGAALAWSNIEERDSRGSLYWYDPEEGKEHLQSGITKDEALGIVEDLKGFLSRV